LNCNPVICVPADKNSKEKRDEFSIMQSITDHKLNMEGNIKLKLNEDLELSEDLVQVYGWMKKIEKSL
jgi:hypothetical protein